MNPSQDAMIDALLRKQFDGPVFDEGFSRRVMQRLPQRRRHVAWPVWGGILVGVIACWQVLLVWRVVDGGWQGCLSGHWSARTVTLLLAILGMAVLALAWGVAEADDR